MAKRLKLGWVIGVASGARVGATLVVALGLQVAPRPAHALTCATNEVSLPRDGDVDVPTDTLIWGYGLAPMQLLGPGGAVVPADARSLLVAPGINGSGTTEVLVPREALAPNTAFTVESGWGYRTFTTGAGPLQAPPALPVLLSAEPGAGSSAGHAWVSAGVQFEHAGILIGDIGGLPAFGSVQELLIGGASSSDDARTAPPVAEWLAASSGPGAGRGHCLSWPEGAGDSVDARFGVLDLAGNFSGWTDVELQLPSEADTEESRAAACSLTPCTTSRASGWLPLAMFAFAAAARRLRRAAHFR